ncbi:MAG: hypothetical protein V4864_04885 [Pseudomonadota bacterium]
MNTVFVECDDAARVADAVADVFAAEGMCACGTPPARERLPYDPMQYGTGADNALWACALFPGAQAWIAVKTAPLELLCEPGARTGEMLLAAVCRVLGCAAVAVHLYDSSSMVLAEVSARGEVDVSGVNPQSDDPLHWQGFEIGEDNYMPRSSRPELQPLLLAPSAETQATAMVDLLGGANAPHCDNLTSVVALVQCLPVEAVGARTVYAARRP